MPEPELLLLDEPVSAFDVSMRAQVLNLLADLRPDRGKSCLAVSHDLSVLGFLSHGVGVMHGGRIGERGSVERVTTAPDHDDTRRLLEAARTIARSLDRWRQRRRARMCDTMIAMGTITGTGRTCLAKTSDREPNEARYLTRTPAANHPEGAVVRMTRAEVPQVSHTSAYVGSRPWWMWDFEHGVNEHGLSIGNEAEWSRLPAGTERGLPDMDLLRLTPERARGADEAPAVLTGLIEARALDRAAAPAPGAGVAARGALTQALADAARTFAATLGALQADRLPPRAPNLKEVAATAPTTAVKEPA